MRRNFREQKISRVLARFTKIYVREKAIFSQFAKGYVWEVSVSQFSNR